MNRTSIFVSVVAGILLIACGCKEQQPATTVARPVHTFTANGSVREMSITPETPEFPEHAGKNEFMSYCSMCHSLRYISTQPDFPKKTWQAEVNKMVVKFGAPIDSLTCEKIADYLWAIKGKGG